MGRKIPGKKHRGVKDPEKQAAIRFEKIKDKINAPPANPDDQHVPNRLKRLMELRERVKRGDFNKKGKKKHEIEPKKFNMKQKTYEKPVPKFEQRPGETDRQFLNRVNRICMDVTREAKFEDKYRVDIIRNEQGDVEKVVKRPKDELEVLMKKAKKEKKEKGKKKKKVHDEEGKVKLTKSQKWQMKKKDKKLKKKNNFDENNEIVTREYIKFGEVAHEPPSLVTPRKIEKSSTAARPGNKQLLLKSLLGANVENKTAKRVIDKKGKRKGLPNALRRQLDNQQKEIVQAYKDLKAKKYANK